MCYQTTQWHLQDLPTFWLKTMGKKEMAEVEKKKKKERKPGAMEGCAVIRKVDT